MLKTGASVQMPEMRTDRGYGNVDVGCGLLAACARKINGTGSTLSAPAWPPLQCGSSVCVCISKVLRLVRNEI